MTVGRTPDERTSVIGSRVTIISTRKGSIAKTRESSLILAKINAIFSASRKITWKRWSGNRPKLAKPVHKITGLGKTFAVWGINLAGISDFFRSISNSCRCRKSTRRFLLLVLGAGPEYFFKLYQWFAALIQRFISLTSVFFDSICLCQNKLEDCFAGLGKTSAGLEAVPNDITINIWRIV